MTVIQGTTQLLGVMGHPIEHSLSPIMHNAALTQMGLDYAYLPLLVHPNQLKTAIAGLEAIHLRGFSVTLPHKQAIIPLLSNVTDLARSVGAVNTVWRTESGWQGTNTDVAGFLAPLKDYAQDWTQSTAIVLGNGGAARAVVAGCVQLGCKAIQVVGRNLEKLQAFQVSWATSSIVAPLSIHAWEELPDLLPHATLVVNTTPIGMAPHGEASPLDPEVLRLLQPGAIVYDLIYSPNPTRLLREATSFGAIAIDGLEMLVQQGAVALQLWVDRPVPVAVMRQALRTHLKLD